MSKTITGRELVVTTTLLGYQSLYYSSEPNSWMSIKPIVTRIIDLTFKGTGRGDTKQIHSTPERVARVQRHTG